MKSKVVSFLTIASVVAVLLFGACAASPSAQEIPMPDQTVELENPNLARIYIYRNDQEWGTTHYVTIYQGDVKVGMLGEDDYFCWEYHPGRTTLRVVIERSGLQSGTKQGIALRDLEAGMILYGRIDFPVSRRRPTITWMVPSDGRQAISQLRPAPTTR